MKTESDMTVFYCSTCESMKNPNRFKDPSRPTHYCPDCSGKITHYDSLQDILADRI